MLGKRYLWAVLAGFVTLQPAAISAQDAQLLQQAQAGEAGAQFQLAMQYRHGDGVLQNHALAVEWLTKAADQGHLPAQNRLAQHLYNGMGTEQDIEAALALFAKAAASGRPQYQREYGDALLGAGRASQAAEAFQLAADKGDFEAQVSLGVLYQTGQGVPKDAARAFALFQEPAIAGMARAQNNLGLLYVRGEGVEQDYERAAQMFQFAAEQGLHAAMTNLGVMYENGFGVPVDEVRAHELYKMGGRKEVGHEVTLQFPLYEPRLLPLNPSEGVPEALRKRAGLGDPLAQFQMAWLLLQDPQITRQDMALAVHSMQAAAQAGIIAAQANLGWMYFEGTGLPQDYVLGHMWLLLASASGEEQLQTLSAQLSRNLLPMQIQEAQERAARRLQSMRE